MRNYLTLVLGLIVLSTPALASRARLESLGESKNGSLYVADVNNVYYNPAFINDFKKKLVLEHGAAANTASDTTTAGKAQALFTNTFGDFAYGIGLNHVNDRIITIGAAMSAANGGATRTFLNPDNAVSLYVGGDMGMKWGASLNWMGNSDKNTTSRSSTFWGLNLGANSGSFSAFADVALASGAKGSSGAATPVMQRANDEVKGKIGFDLGATFGFMDNYTVFGKFTMNGAELLNDQTTAGTNAKAFEIASSTMEAGVGYKKDVTKSTNLFSRLELGMSTVETKTTAAVGGAITTATTKAFNMPLIIGVETAALSWLTVRGSVAQSLFGRTTTSAAVSAQNQNSTSVAAGLGMTFGDLVIDGLVANTGAGNTSIGTSGSGANSATNNWGFGDNMLTRLSATYNF